MISLQLFFCFTGLPLTEAELHEAAIQSGVLHTDDDFLDEVFRKECERIIPHSEELEPKDCSKAFIYLKRNFVTPSAYSINITVVNLILYIPLKIRKLP